MDDRLKPGQLHETPEEHNDPDTYPEKGDGDSDTEGSMRGMPAYNPSKVTRAADEGSSAELRREREADAESGGYDDPRYGKVRSLPSQS